MIQAEQAKCEAKSLPRGASTSSQLERQRAQTAAGVRGVRLALSGVEEGEGLAAHLAITEPAQSVCTRAYSGGQRIAQDAPQLAGPCSPNAPGWKGMLYRFRTVPHSHPEQC